MKTYKGKITTLKPNQVFVFGANTQGRHGKGSALQAVKFGAIYGKLGHIGNTYSIVTKDLTKKTHPSISKENITKQIEDLYLYATQHPKLDFLICYSGNGVYLNGYSNEEMAKMFSTIDIPNNIIFEEYFYKQICLYLYKE